MANKLNIYQRIAKVTEAVGSFAKDGFNSHHKYKFAGIETIVGKINPHCLEHGIALVQEARMLEPIKNEGKDIARCEVITHAINVDDPEDRVTTVTAGYGYDSTDKGIYKAISGGRKYAIFGLFNVHAGNDDPEYDSKPSKPSQKPPGAPQATTAPAGKRGDHPTAKQVAMIYARAKKLWDDEHAFRTYLLKWFKYTDDPAELSYDEAQAVIQYIEKKEAERG